MPRRTRPFPDARCFVQTLGLESPQAWRAWARSPERPPDIPQHPQRLYRGHGWAGWADWLGTECVISRGRAFRPFAEARAFARTLGLQNWKQWEAWAWTTARPADIPGEPWKLYKGAGWVSVGDWLGTARIASHLRHFRDFEVARRFARGLGLESVPAWWRWCASGQRPADIPAHPDVTYAQVGWAGWGDWLGTQRRAPGHGVRAFAKARAWVHTLGLRTQAEWRAWSRTAARPPDIPGDPAQTYRTEGWTHWGDWLGSGTSPRQRRHR